MSLMTTEYLGTAAGFPRVSGDEPQTRSPGRAELEFSPRERG